MSQLFTHRYNPPFTLRLFMRTQPAGADAPRYYQIVLEQDLRGGWTLFREGKRRPNEAAEKFPMNRINAWRAWSSDRS